MTNPIDQTHDGRLAGPGSTGVEISSLGHGLGIRRHGCFARETFRTTRHVIGSYNCWSTRFRHHNFLEATAKSQQGNSAAESHNYCPAALVPRGSTSSSSKTRISLSEKSILACKDWRAFLEISRGAFPCTRGARIVSDRPAMTTGIFTASLEVSRAPFPKRKRLTSEKANGWWSA